MRRLARRWLDALDEAAALPDDELPVRRRSDGPPPPHRWAERDPVAAARLARVPGVVTGSPTAHPLPPENLITPDSVRRLAWSPPERVTAETVGRAARLRRPPWQVGLIADAAHGAARRRQPALGAYGWPYHATGDASR